MSGVPYTFASATSSIPLSQLDANFATNATLGNATVGLGNTTTTVGNLTVSNVTINGLSGGGANGVVYINSSNVATANASAFVFDGSNLGIGTTSPNRTGFTSPVLSITNGTSGIVELIGTQTADGTIGQVSFYNTSSSVRVGQILGLRSGANNSGAIAFQTNNAGTLSEVGRFNSSGQLLIGCTSSTVSGVGFSIYQGQTSALSLSSYQDGAKQFVISNNNGNTSIYSGNGSSGVVLSQNSTSWGTFSDSRLKNITGTYITPLTDIAQIQAVKFTWKNDSTNKAQVGVIAQSVLPVVPEAIDKGENFGDTSGTSYYSVKYTELIPLMIASIQALTAQVTTLQSQVAALQAKVGA
jgi:Chaperone of endosialidase